MIKLLLSFLLCMIFILPTVNAGILIEPDNLSDTINYRTYKNVGKEGIHEYAIIKSVDKYEKENYFLRVSVNYNNSPSRATKYLLNDKVDFNVDSKIYKAKKVINSFYPRLFQAPSVFDFSFYSIPEECISFIKKSKTLSFTVYVPEIKPIEISINDDNRAEFINIIENGHFKNYLEDINSKTINYQPAK